MSAIDHKNEEKECEDSDVDCWNRINLDIFHSEDGESSCSEDSEESKLDGDENEEPWMPSDNNDDESQDLDLGQDTAIDEDEKRYQNVDANGAEDEYHYLDQYEADCEDQDTEMDGDEECHQNTNPSEDQHETPHSKPNTESYQKPPLYQHNLPSDNPSLPQVAESNPSPTPGPHYEIIALGQHHLWMI